MSAPADEAAMARGCPLCMAAPGRDCMFPDFGGYTTYRGFVHTERTMTPEGARDYRLRALLRRRADLNDEVRRLEGLILALDVEIWETENAE